MAKKLTEKQERYSELLERFVDFTYREETDLGFRVEWLFEKINESGLFTIEPPKKPIDKVLGQILLFQVISMFSAMTGAGSLSPYTRELFEGAAYRRDPDMDIELGHTKSISPGPLQVRVGWDSKRPFFFADLRGDAPTCLLFILRMIMEVEGITRVKICEECGRVFFPKRADRKRCYPPRTCDADVHKKARQLKARQLKAKGGK